MLSDDLISQIEFLKEVEKLKTIRRTNRTLDNGRHENAAEHSWHVALMAITLSSYADSVIDIFRVSKMLLIHDIVEIDAGDTWLYSEKRESAHQAEAIAAARLFGLLPTALGAEFRALWQEFESRETPEAKFAASIDGIQPLLNHLITRQEMDPLIGVDQVMQKKEFIKQFAPKLWMLAESLIDESVEKGIYSVG